MQQDYTYAVARIRYRETRLLSDADLQSLFSAKDVETVLRLLRDKGWGNSSKNETPEEMLRSESEKTWSFISEIVPDRAAFDFLLAENDFHNLKVAVKAITMDQQPDDMFLFNAPTDPKTLYEAIQKREYRLLPEYLEKPAREAMSTLLQTSDGQLCDVIIDKACMEYIGKLGKESDDEIIRLYCELFVASANIRIAVRCAKTRKQIDFIRRSMAACESIDAERLANAASLGYEEILRYLEKTDYRSAVSAIEESTATFEKWCDDYLIGILKSQKWEPFGIGPVVAYVIARENEFKAVRMILSAKESDMPLDIIKGRLRMMYV